MIRMLHYVRDEKFSSMVIPQFEKRSDIQSQYIYYRRHKDAPFRYLQDCNQVRIIEKRRELKEILQSDDYDVLYLHSLYIDTWPLLWLIPANKTVIWWSWGHELYLPNPYGQKHSFFSFNTILPHTQQAIDKTTTRLTKLKLNLRGIALDVVWPIVKKKIVRRIDYFRPVLHIEYEMMTKVSGFHAKAFYLPRLDPQKMKHADGPVLNAEGAIQIGNSGSTSCNHLDMWKYVKQYVPCNRKIVIPLSYGRENYDSFVKQTIKADHDNVETMDVFLPKEEYFDIVNECTYFVHGAIRQHAMGNINKALNAGRKVFLFKDSLIYKQLKSNGYVVFAIEEINDSSFNTPLTVEEFWQNIDARKRELAFRDEIGQKALEEIDNKYCLDK